MEIIINRGFLKLSSFVDRLPVRLFSVVFSVAYLIIAMHLPVSIRTGLIHDDALFWGNAYQIVQGNWLGAYTQMTLAKGSGFPLFLAINAVLGFPVTLLIALLYLFACGLIANTLREVGLNKYLVLTIFVIILFHPALFPTIIIRDNIYPALSLIIISGVIRLVFTRQQHGRQIMSVVPYGLAFGFFWVTREEGIWIVPGLLVVLFFNVLQLKKQKIPVKDVFYRFAFFSLIATIFVSLIASINYYNYGKFEAVDVKGKAFAQALKSLNSVDVGSDLPYLPVSFNKRQEIYRVSPTFSQLKNYFEDKGKWWTSFGCKIYPWTCGDYAGGWFMWALRDAVASNGHYESPVRAADFYYSITKEIETACEHGVIKCKANLIPLMPNVTTTQLKELPGKTVEGFKLAMVQFPVPATQGPSWDPLDQLQRARLFLGNPHTTLAPSEQKNEGNNDYGQNLPIKIKIFLANLYKKIIPILVLLGAVVYVMYIIFIWIGKTSITDVFIISTMMWCLVFSRILLLVLVDISSFPAINMLYMSAVFPIICLSALVSLQLMFEVTSLFLKKI